jgi:hypothetical protein
MRAQRRHQERDLQPVAQPERDHDANQNRAADSHQRADADGGGHGASLGSVTEPAQAGSVAPASGSASSLPSLWILLGAVILIGAIVWIAHASGRRSAARAGSRSTLVDAYAKGAPGGPALADADARWAGLEARADDLTQELYALRESAPGEEDRARVEDVLASLQALRSAMAAGPAAVGAAGSTVPGEPRAGLVCSRLLSFETAIRALREPERLPRI